MAGAVKTFTFAARQPEIAECGVVFLKFTEGDLRAEYLSGSEVKNEDGTWSYQFLIQEDDLPAGLTLDEAASCNVIAPYWSCVTEEEEEEGDDCQYRTIRCFDDIPIIEGFGENDMIPILQHDEDCDTWCLAAMNPYDFVSQASTPP